MFILSPSFFYSFLCLLFSSSISSSSFCGARVKVVLLLNWAIYSGLSTLMLSLGPSLQLVYFSFYLFLLLPSCKESALHAFSAYQTCAIGTWMPITTQWISNRKYRQQTSIANARLERLPLRFLTTHFFSVLLKILI